MNFWDHYNLYLDNKPKLEDLHKQISQITSNFRNIKFDVEETKEILTNLLNSRLFKDIHVDDWICNENGSLLYIRNTQLTVREDIPEDIIYGENFPQDGLVTFIGIYMYNYELWIQDANDDPIYLNFEEFIKWSRTTVKSAEK